MGDPHAAGVGTSLRARLPASVLITDPDAMTDFRQDEALTASAGRPAAVVKARTTEDVVATLRVASDRAVPVVTRGAGSGLAGGANALDGCIILSTIAMDRILAIDEVERTATVEAGVVTGRLARAVGERGLWYPPDPSSRDLSTIGGNIATNAGGACCLKYGVTGDHVAALTAVLADGSVINTGRSTRKNVAGFDLTRLLVGSEGALAVVVSATLRLRPAPPPASTMVALFPNVTATGAAIVEIEHVASPSLLELMDRTTLDAVEAMTHMGLEPDAGALLLVQCDDDDAASAIDRCAAVCSAAGATYVGHTTDPDEGEMLLAARRAALPALQRLGATLLDDVAVPKGSIPTMVTAIEEIARRFEVTVGTFGHAGDGNLHPTIVFPRDDADVASRARSAFDAIVVAAVQLGGTITGEHGVGSLKTGYLEAMVGAPERALMQRVKMAFDPDGILNPGRAI